MKYNFNYGVLTSNLSFSCGNLFPSLMKDMGYPIIGEKSGGGACAVQQFVTPEGLQYQLSSARARLTNDKWENIDGGIEPDYIIDLSGAAPDFSALYDVAAISNYIKDSSGDVPSGIQVLPAAPSASYGQWYALDGQRLSGKPTRKGLYIRNGKKVQVK